MWFTLKASALLIFQTESSRFKKGHSTIVQAGSFLNHRFNTGEPAPVQQTGIFSINSPSYCQFG